MYRFDPIGWNGWKPVTVNATVAAGLRLHKTRAPIPRILRRNTDTFRIRPTLMPVRRSLPWDRTGSVRGTYGDTAHSRVARGVFLQ